MIKRDSAIAVDIIYTLVFFILGSLVASYFKLQIQTTAAYFFAPLFIIPISLAGVLLNRVSDKFDFAQEVIHATESRRFKYHIVSLQYLLCGYIIFLLCSAIYTGFAFYHYREPYADITIPISIGLALAAVRIFIFILRNLFMINKTISHLKELAVKQKRVEEMKKDLS
ncbi:hypothetical protein [Suttonella ornithocola]|uniref:Uncharacterized protein n=1 Tax=Suttonella ornithocola TaxID=279832 RepID=A0A380MWS5_9GAMM|nr:hypothetical protein [Suttonella ornithocola]SUO96722.1 Uncharacterised protein [Suttonella ornithocola]